MEINSTAIIYYHIKLLHKSKDFFHTWFVVTVIISMLSIKRQTTAHLLTLPKSQCVFEHQPHRENLHHQ
jgi:hypothetical protein